ncbi:MAG: putative collagen-binding domain-containing protein, partial [bacterium]
EIDPYSSPIVVHTWANHEEIYQPLLGESSIEGPSLQIAEVENVYSETLKWVKRSKKSGKQWVVSLDEIGPASTGVKPDTVDSGHDEVRKRALWANLMAGGAGCEWYFGYDYPDNDLNLEDFRSRERMWHLTKIAVDFFQAHLPFADMDPDDSLVKTSDTHCLAKEGHCYALYVVSGGKAEVWLPEAVYSVSWFDPRGGGALVEGSVKEVRGGGFRDIGSAPGQYDQDWVAVLNLVGDPPSAPSRPSALQ